MPESEFNVAEAQASSPAEIRSAHPGWSIFLPFITFVVFYLGLSLVLNDFYAVPMPIAFLVAGATALLMNHRQSFGVKIDNFCHGMGDSKIMMMVLIFLLAGAFAQVCMDMGAVQAAVTLAQNAIPPSLLLCGTFVVACFISLAIGTSCGTIAALTPIAASLAGTAGGVPEMLLGAVVGGAMFGDNLSMISDTTIAATRTQNVQMRDKFFTNIKMVMPAAVVVILIYVMFGREGVDFAPPEIATAHFVLVFPYVLVLLLALCGANVMAALFIGAVVAAIIGACVPGDFSLVNALKSSGKGALAMGETLTVALLAGGVLKTINSNGGVQFLLDKVERFIRGSRTCELGTALIVSLVNLLTANNTVAIIIAGPVAKDLSSRYNCEPKRIAGILDVASCVVQGVIPYGAQILMAVGTAKTVGLDTSPMLVIKYLFYPMLMAVALLAYIALNGKTGKRQAATLTTDKP